MIRRQHVTCLRLGSLLAVKLEITSKHSVWAFVGAFGASHFF